MAPSGAADSLSAMRPVAARSGQRGELWHRIKRNRWGYLFISPFFILFAIFGLFPPLFAFYLSFHKWDIMNPMQFVGLANYSRVLGDQLFWKAFINNIIFVIAEAVPELALSLLIAYLLDSYTRRLRNALLAAYFSPMVTSSVAVAIIFGLMYGVNFGLINAGLRMLGVPPVRWLTEPVPMKLALIFLLLWRWLGWNTVLYLAGLQSISHDYYEAARVDGANGMQVFLRITVPLMRPTILYTTILGIIGTLQLFAEPYLLTLEGGLGGGSLGGRANSLLTMVMYLYQNGFGYFRFGYASAIAYVMFVIVLAFSLANVRLIGQAD